MRASEIILILRRRKDFADNTEVMHTVVSLALTAERQLKELSENLDRHLDEINSDWYHGKLWRELMHSNDLSTVSYNQVFPLTS